MYLLYSSRPYLILLIDVNRALAKKLYWMTGLPKCGRVQIAKGSFKFCG